MTIKEEQKQDRSLTTAVYIMTALEAVACGLLLFFGTRKSRKRKHEHFFY